MINLSVQSEDSGWNIVLVPTLVLTLNKRVHTAPIRLALKLKGKLTWHCSSLPGQHHHQRKRGLATRSETERCLYPWETISSCTDQVLGPLWASPKLMDSSHDQFWEAEVSGPLITLSLIVNDCYTVISKSLGQLLDPSRKLLFPRKRTKTLFPMY